MEKVDRGSGVCMGIVCDLWVEGDGIAVWRLGL